jgi:hypothetical protein
MPMIQALTALVDHITHMAEIIINEVAFEYARFKDFLNNQVQEIIVQYKRKCNMFLENMLESEIKGI